jgi:6-phosphogluconolactonase
MKEMIALKPALRIFDSSEALAAEAATEFYARARRAIGRSGRFNVVLSGGNTPLCLYGLLALRAASDPLDWDKVDWFWGDERAVPPDDPQSNFRAARETLLSRIPVRPESIHRIRTEMGTAELAAREYEAEIRRVFSLRAGAFPRFDLVFLGMGTDGHTASLFPGSAAARETRRIAVADYVEKLASWRITLTVPVLTRAGCVIFLIEGSEKAEAVHNTLEGGGDPPPPARAIQPAGGELLWLIDRRAARLLYEERRPRDGQRAE